MYMWNCTVQFDARTPTERGRATPSRHLDNQSSIRLLRTESIKEDPPGTM